MPLENVSEARDGAIQGDPVGYPSEEGGRQKEGRQTGDFGQEMDAMLPFLVDITLANELLREALPILMVVGGEKVGAILRKWMDGS